MIAVEPLCYTAADSEQCEQVATAVSTGCWYALSVWSERVMQCIVACTQQQMLLVDSTSAAAMLLLLSVSSMYTHTQAV
jgi:hypothetical protein